VRFGQGPVCKDGEKMTESSRAAPGEFRPKRIIVWSVTGQPEETSGQTAAFYFERVAGWEILSKSHTKSQTQAGPRPAANQLNARAWRIAG